VRLQLVTLIRRVNPRTRDSSVGLRAGIDSIERIDPIDPVAKAQLIVSGNARTPLPASSWSETAGPIRARGDPTDAATVRRG